MLNQINHWIEYSAATVDFVLLLRVLALRLQRTYLFLTLACALAVIFDVANLLFAEKSPRVQIYSEVFLSCVFPLAAWDIFEEIAASVKALRRLAMLRTLASFIIVAFFGMIWSISISETDDPTGLAFPLAICLVISTASAAGCLGFLWTMHRGMQLQKTLLRRNTTVWMTFFGLLMAGDLFSWFLVMGAGFLAQPARAEAGAISNAVLNGYGIGITLWCAVKLRGVPKDLSAPVSESEL